MPHRRKKTLGCILTILILAALGYVLHPPILRTAARLWIVSDTPAAADIIVIHGGQIFSRPPKAAELYQAGHAPLLFIMREVYVPHLHADTPGAERAKFIEGTLHKVGVPLEAMRFTDSKVSSTWEEGEQFANWVRSLPPSDRPKSALLVTDAFHSRRARWSFRRHTRKFDIDLKVITVPHRKYEVDSWWTSEHGRHDFLSEIKKFFFYQLRYFNQPKNP